MAEHYFNTACSCEHCQAMDRLHALADVFEHLGDYSAADCCNEWAQRLRIGAATGSLMAAAIVRGVRPGMPCQHRRIGAWYLCNFGLDEVRTCPDCNLIEKRPVP